MLRVLVHSADISDAEGAKWLLTAHHDCFPRPKEMRVDEGDASRLDTWLQHHTTTSANVIEKPVGQKGGAVIPKRWVVKRSIAWAGRNRWERRIIIRRNNRNPESSEAFLYLGSIAMLLNWLYPRS